MLTKKQFDVLDVIIESNKILSQREISQKSSISLGGVNKILNELSELHLVQNNEITEKGIEQMQNYRVKRAIFIAAGFGSRLVPITLNTPKPLVRVKGQRIIDSSLDALIEAGIEEIYIVRGYLSEQFDQLLYKYPNIKFIENPMYNEANNLLSIVCAGDLLQNAYVLEADLLLFNKKIIKKYQYSSNYLGIPVDRTDDWCFYVTGGIIEKMSIGGEKCFQMVGISYWTQEDGKKISHDAKFVFSSPGGKERFWDQVPLEYCIKNYKVGVRECSFSDIKEIDTYSELKEIDESYR
ncbi:NTP transferase domain-containing protein [Acholeplasma sp. OttesenSCG-928-E16]|nr:NTP transferase domain-containing protein [Acholeplasma sp. OttesenSCG-928-E16]